MAENITNKKSYVHKANSNRANASDFDKKYRILELLREKFGINALGMVDEFFFMRDKISNKVMIERTIQKSPSLFYNFDINKMDLYVKERRTATDDIIIEIDGLTHGFFDEITSSQQTIDRDENYRLGGYTEEKKNYLKLHTEDLKQDDDTLTSTIEYKLGIRSLLHAKTCQSIPKNDNLPQ